MSDLFPPFAPDKDEPKRRLFKPVPLRVIVPNLITLLALCLGLTAIRLAYEGRLEPAVTAILIAAALDGLDGRIARLLKGTSRFGAELDSLADFLNFGVAPALILYSFTLNQLKSFGWIAALVLAIAAALRLARFNVMLDDPHRPEWKKNFFVGMPAPAGAVVALLPIYLSFLGLSINIAGAALVAFFTICVALMMVSTIPTYAGKTIGTRIPRNLVLPMFVAVVCFAAVLLSFTFETIALLTLAYVCAIPLGVMRYKTLERRWDSRSTIAPTVGAGDLSAEKSINPVS